MSRCERSVFVCTRIVLESRELDGALLVDERGKLEAIFTRAQSELFCKENEGKVKVERVRSGCVLLAGVVDSHVHVNEPGRTAWEGFRTATAAAAAAGATTIADVPLSVHKACDVQVERVRAGCVLLAGVVDSHVHVNEPGRTAWEGFRTATAAAAAAGATTIADMPLSVHKACDVQVERVRAGCVLLAGVVDSHVHVNEPGHTAWEGFRTATAAAAAAGATTIADMPLSVHKACDVQVERVRAGCVLLAGVVDSHVHVNEPGRTAWEGFRTATAAAAAAGATTIADMPLSVHKACDVQVERVRAGCVLLAGVVDSHVHVNEPGRTAWEGFRTATAAAAAAGATTIADMPLSVHKACDVQVERVRAGCVLLAGVVDSHVHVNEPGRTAWEGFRTATAAAAAAGATTIADMPLSVHKACDVQVERVRAGCVLLAGVVDSHVHVNEPGRTAWEGFRTATAAAAAAGATTIADMPLSVHKACDVQVERVRAGCVLLAGVVDSHVHVNEPGRTAWEGFRTATAAAAAAGATTIADMPLNSIPPTTTLENLKVKAAAARDSAYVDVGFWGGVVPGNESELKQLVAAGVVGFKCFLCPSGVEEFPNVTADDLEKAFSALEGTGSVLAFHAELECNADTDECKKDADPEEYQTYLASRPPDMELNAVNLISQFTELYDVRVHIVHVSAAGCVPVLERMRAARRRRAGDAAAAWRHGGGGGGGAGITAETCHHYLTLSAEEVPRGRSEFKCAPPLRDADNREMLWTYLKEGKLDLVVSDHSPCTSDLKCCNFLSAWGGISSVQFGLSLFWTGAKRRGFTLHDVTRLLSAAPAALCGLAATKGSLAAGLDADFLVFDPDATFTVTPESVRHKNKLTPYVGMELTGRVLKTYLRGRLIYDGELVGEPSGHLLLKQ